MNLQPMPAILANDADAWALRINARWRASVESIIEVGRLLIDAKAALPHGAFGAMLETDLTFSASTAQRLMAVASDNRLSNPAHAQLLPASWMTLYELTKLSDEEFDSAVEARVIRPDMDRREIAERIRPTPARIAHPMTDKEIAAGEPPVGKGLTHVPAEINPVREAGLGGGSPAPMPNGARAIAPSRHEPDDSLDYFPTPPWATRALLDRVFPHLERRGHTRYQTAWEPACGEGHMAEVLREYFRHVVATDVQDYGHGDYLADFTASELSNNADWIITNPPFGDKSEAFVLKALELAGTGVAMFVRLQWLETIGRYERVFRDKPPTLIAIFAERVPLCKGEWKPDGDTLTAYIWLVWIKGAEPRAPFWITPGCREALTMPDDAERFTAKPVKKRSEET